MRIESVRVLNYKSFRETEAIPFGRNFTIIVGQNNSGKSALLETLRADKLQNKPHLAPHDSRNEFPPIPNPLSMVEFELSMSGEELKWWLLSRKANIRIPTGSTEEAKEARQIEALFAESSLHFRIRYRGGSWESSAIPCCTSFATSGRSMMFAVDDNRQSFRVHSLVNRDQDDLGAFLGPCYAESIYIFDAERLNVGQSGIEASDVLRSDAGNLASALLRLQANSAAMQRFTSSLRTVFPSIFEMTSVAINSNTAAISVRMRSGSGGVATPGISVQLDDCGTGVSQVAAMLYVAITSPTSRIIVIDEPNSFLHPGASKKLLALLKQFGNQYIISTHSAEVIRASAPDMMHSVAWNGRESVVTKFDRSNVESIRGLLAELGVHLSDVFGADFVLWVEGPTEERCFPLLLKKAGIQLSPGIAIVGVAATGDFEKKRKGPLVWEVYSRLSAGHALFPPALTFVFDREKRTDADIADLERQSQNKIRFLPRRLFENYLVHPEAIAAVLAQEGLDAAACSAEKVREWIIANGAKQAYIADQYTGELLGPDWSAKVDAATLLEDLFTELSGATLQYQKTKHSVLLTEWLLEHDAEHLTEISAFVVALVPE